CLRLHSNPAQFADELDHFARGTLLRSHIDSHLSEMNGSHSHGWYSPNRMVLHAIPANLGRRMFCQTRCSRLLLLATAFWSSRWRFSGCRSETCDCLRQRAPCVA